MKLFLKDHVGLMFLYLFTFISLPIMIDQLDHFTNHYPYFIFLAMISLGFFLMIRYARRKKIYRHLVEKHEQTTNFSIYKPSASIEKAYAAQLQSIQSHLLNKEDESEAFLEEQQLMISHAVHQMKTPLSVIQLLIQSNQLKEPNLFLEWQKVKTESDKLNFSLNQLLTYSRTTKLLADLKIEPIPLKLVVQEVINDLKDYFIEKELYPKTMIADEITVYSDRKWLKVVIYQLLSNAVKYGKQGSNVFIAYENEKLSIKNNGETISKSEINRVFEVFYTGTKGRTKGEATGIGLYLVKKILTTLNHPYKLTSANQATIFIIDFSDRIKATT